MKRKSVFLAGLLFLLSCMPTVTVMADTQATSVSYSVPATITFTDYDGTSTTQKLEVGKTLKEPASKGKKGSLFLGWRDEATGLLWNFSDPVSDNLNLTASYVEVQEEKDGSLKLENGKFSVSIEIDNQTTEVGIGTSEKELLQMLFQDGTITAKELEQITNGASLDIVLVVKDGSSTVTAASRAQMSQAADGYTVAQYLDISLFKYLTVNGKTGEGEAIHETSKMITVSVVVPDSLINNDSNVNRTYIILRNHQGSVSVLDSSYDPEPRILTFQTNHFSDYAIGYKDVKKDISGNNSGNQTNAANTGSSGTGTAARTLSQTGRSIPKTADSSGVEQNSILLLFSGIIMAWLFTVRKNKKNS